MLELTARYGEAHRHYHDLRHVAEMLMQGRVFPLDAVQVWAVWFHDAVYDPRRDDNEEESARLAEARLPAHGLTASDVAAVAAIVRDTRAHVPTQPRSAPVLDLDLAPLALPSEEFQRNRRRIRAEYAHVDAETFGMGTQRFAAAMLARDRIYHTEWGRSLESRARRNLQSLISDRG